MAFNPFKGRPKGVPPAARPGVEFVSNKDGHDDDDNNTNNDNRAVALLDERIAERRNSSFLSSRNNSSHHSRASSSTRARMVDGGDQKPPARATAASKPAMMMSNSSHSHYSSNSKNNKPHSELDDLEIKRQARAEALAAAGSNNNAALDGRNSLHQLDRNIRARRQQQRGTSRRMSLPNIPLGLFSNRTNKKDNASFKPKKKTKAVITSRPTKNDNDADNKSDSRQNALQVIERDIEAKNQARRSIVEGTYTTTSANYSASLGRVSSSATNTTTMTTTTTARPCDDHAIKQRARSSLLQQGTAIPVGRASSSIMGGASSAEKETTNTAKGSGNDNDRIGTTSMKDGGPKKNNDDKAVIAVAKDAVAAAVHSLGLMEGDDEEEWIEEEQDLYHKNNANADTNKNKSGQDMEVPSSNNNRGGNWAKIHVIDDRGRGGTLLESDEERGDRRRNNRMGQDPLSQDDYFGVEFGTMRLGTDPLRSDSHDDDQDIVEFHNVEDDKLAVARAVEEEDEDEMFIPAAVEYDPDSKPAIAIYKKRRFRVYCSLAFFMILATIVAIVIPIQVGKNSKKGDGENGRPTMAPTTFRESLGIQGQLEKFVGSAKFDDPESPHSKALNWILHEDPMVLTPNAENLLQRFILAYFYFHTTGEGPWNTCNPPQANETADCEMESVYSFEPFESEFTPAVRWLSDRSECHWGGIVCENKIAFLLSSRAQGLTGTFPEDLFLLSKLRFINFAWNELEGTLPSLSSQMKPVTNLELQYNYFSGVIPSDIFQLEKLVRINLAANRFTGTLSIPANAKSKNTLKGIFLFENALSGTVPSEISQFSDLGYLRFARNNFSGSLPSELGLLSNLQELWMNENYLNGTLPTEIGELNALQDLRLHKTDLSGELPDELFNLSRIARIDLYDANFTGTISTLIGNLSPTLSILRLRKNNFYGELPTEMNLLTALQSFWIHYTSLEGAVPSGLCNLRDELILRELVADCLPNENSGVAEIECPDGCCTACCDGVTGDCVDMLNRSSNGK